MNSNILRIAMVTAGVLLASSSSAAVSFLKGAAADISETGMVVSNAKHSYYNGMAAKLSRVNASIEYSPSHSDFYGINGVDYFCETSVSAISGNGLAAVGSVFHDGYAKVWPNHESYQDGVMSTANTLSGINNNRDLAGYSTDNGRTVANRWVVNGALPDSRNTGYDYTTWAATQLYTPANASSKAADINNAGVVVGQTTTEESMMATLWNGTNATYLSNPNGGTSFASSINDAGQVVGTAGGFATLWDNGVATTLGIGQALSISGNGLIAGYSLTQDNNRFAALWSNGQTIDLNSYLSEAEKSAGWLLAEATGVNSQGYVVGKAINTQTGAVAGFVTPVPEPETYALMLGGLGLVGAAVRRKRKAATVFSRSAVECTPVC